MSIKKDSLIIADFADDTTPAGAQFEDFINSKRSQWQDNPLVGVAVPADSPITDRQVSYWATTPGTYTNFDSIAVTAGQIVWLYNTIDQDTGACAWFGEVLATSVSTDNFQRSAAPVAITEGQHTVSFPLAFATPPTCIIITVYNETDRETPTVTLLMSTADENGFDYDSSSVGFINWIAYL